MQIFRCRLCGEAYVGPGKPPTCPFCGAHSKHLIYGKDWTDENSEVELSELSRKNTETTLQLEISNAQFYRACYKDAKDPEVAAMFKSLSKMETEHASVAAKLLGIENDEATKVGKSKDSDLENIRESLKREQNALEHYSTFRSEAVEERIKTVFDTLLEIEKDHLSIDNTELDRLSS